MIRFMQSVMHRTKPEKPQRKDLEMILSTVLSIVLAGAFGLILASLYEFTTEGLPR